MRAQARPDRAAQSVSVEDTDKTVVWPDGRNYGSAGMMRCCESRQKACIKVMKNCHNMANNL